jgi:hypothetical protein
VWESPVYVFKNPPPGQFISKDQMQYGDGGFGSRSNYSLPVNLPENDLFKDFKVNRPFGFMMRILKERDFYGNIHQRSISSPGQPNMYYMEHICGAAKAMDDLAAGDLKSLKADGVEMSSIDDFNKLSSYQLLGLPQTFVYFPSK